MIALCEAESDGGVDVGAGVLRIADVDQEVRHSRGAILHELYLASRNLCGGEAAGRRRHPIAAVEDFELAAGNVVDRIGKIGETGIADVEFAVRQHRGAGLIDGQRKTVEDRTDIDGRGDGGAVHDVVVCRPGHRAGAVGRARGELDLLQRRVEIGRRRRAGECRQEDRRLVGICGVVEMVIDRAIRISEDSVTSPVDRESVATMEA